MRIVTINQAASKWRSEFANHLAIISAIYLLIYHSLLSSLLLLFTILAKEIAHLEEKSPHLEAASPTCQNMSHIIVPHTSSARQISNYSLLPKIRWECNMIVTSFDYCCKLIKELLLKPMHLNCVVCCNIFRSMDYFI